LENNLQTLLQGVAESVDSSIDLSPEEEKEIKGCISDFVKAIREQNIDLLTDVIDESGELALIHEIWGWRALSILALWEDKVESFDFTSVSIDGDAIQVMITWPHPLEKEHRGSTLWLIEHEDGRLVVDEVYPEWEVGDLSREYTYFEDLNDNGVLLPYISEAKNPLEQRLRESIEQRKIAFVNALMMFKMARILELQLSGDIIQQDCNLWAAAIDAFFELDLSNKKIANLYGVELAVLEETMAKIEDVSLEMMNRFAADDAH
jgi:hypothetical protein